jgi:creatinine amidohydrolase
MVFEIGAALIRQGFHHLIILNGNRPNGTANDAVARHLLDELDRSFDFVVSAVSYWEPAADRIHAMRKSVVGGMGHGCELETSFQLATRPQLVKMAELATAKYGPVGWDLVAPTNPTRTYMRRPRPEAGHAAIFGDPTKATAASGKAFIAAAVDALAETFKNLQGSYQERR